MSGVGSLREKGIRPADIDWQLTTNELSALIASNPTEEAIQCFLENHCYLLLLGRNGPSHSAILSKPKLSDAYVADFGMFGGCNTNWVTFLEIEKPSDRVFTKGGNYSSQLTHALRQVADWKEWISNHKEYFHSVFGGHSYIRFEVMIGRRDDLARHKHLLKAIDKDITVSSFDSLIPIGNPAQHLIGLGEIMIQEKAVSWAEYKSIYRLDSPTPAFPDTWFLYHEWTYPARTR